MISKIAYILASGGLPYPKRILGLTFGVNAAYKIKKDVAEHLPELLLSGNLNPAKINDRVFITNYHGFCRHILKLYGYLIHENLRTIDTLRAIDDSTIQHLTELNVGLSYDAAKEITDLSDAIKNIDRKYFNENWQSYMSKITSHLIPNNFITYNSIILYVITLFRDYPQLRKFYHKYFPIIIVDEFQDTNLISYMLLFYLITDKTKVIFIGDSLQRIYGFIGAIPNLMNDAKSRFNMEEVKLAQNYRFKNNPSMLFLDKNIRLIAEDPSNPQIEKNSIVELNISPDQEQEALWIIEKIQDVIRNDSLAKIAVLVRGRSKNIQITIDRFNENQIDYFYGLYSDDDSDYIDFHKECYNTFIEQLRIQDRISKTYMKQFYDKIETKYKDNQSATIQSLLVLLKLFLKRIIEDYKALSNDDKISFILDTFENKALKQQMEYVDKNVIITTIHGAKGLEWDYVIISDMEQYVFPSYNALCGSCNNKYNSISDDACIINYNKSIEKEFLEELSVFYVGVTRARKSIYFSCSRKRVNYQDRELDSFASCLLSLPGMEWGTQNVFPAAL